jgi:autotransporter-associated beta strand protein
MRFFHTFQTGKSARRLTPALAGLVLLWGHALIASPIWEAPLRADLSLMASNLTVTLTPWVVPGRTFHPESYGAVADGVTVNTAPIQQAIDACSAAGGGVVAFTNGDYVSGTFELKSGVMVDVAAGARILGSTNLADYPDRVEQLDSVMKLNHKFRISLVYAERAQQIGIRGLGEIFFRGDTTNFPGPQTAGPIEGRPFGIRIIECKDVVMQDITLRDAAAWMQNYLSCTNVLIERMTVENQANWNNDGVDIDGCQNVIVRNCWISSEDDALCFKGASLRPMNNVLVENCQIYSTCNAIKFGTDSQGHFQNVLVRDCEAGGPSAAMRVFKRNRAISGISWESVDGGVVSNILSTNIAILRADTPLFLRLGNRGRIPPGYPAPGPGQILRIVFDNITATNAISARGSAFAGISARRIEDVVVRNFNLRSDGGAASYTASTNIAEKIGDYPEASMFGSRLPAFGCWVRHATNVMFFSNNFAVVSADVRPVIAADRATVNIDDPAGKPLDTGINPGSLEVNNATNASAGELMGGALFVKSGAGVLAFTNPISFTGAIQVREGTLDLSAGQKPGAFSPGMPAPALTHRWSFNGSMSDSVGGSTATVIEGGPNNTSLSGSQITLSGGAIGQSDYVELGQDLLGGTTNPVTIELWATQITLQNWARIFDFGTGGNTDYLLMSWNRGTLETDGVRWRDAGSDVLTVNESCQPYNLNTEYHLAMTLQPLAGAQTQVTWYRAPATDGAIGAARGQSTVARTLAQLTDSHDTLGRSLLGNSGDNTANASYNEVRLWNGALSSNQLSQAQASGPNALPALSATPGYTNPIPVLSWLAIAPGASAALTNGAMQFQTVTNNGTLRLIGNAQLAVSGSLVNQGVLDIINWNGTVPAAWTNSGTVLDRSSVRIVDCKRVGATFQITLPGYAGHHFQLQQARAASLTGPWDDLGIPVAGDGADILFSVPAGASNAFYRVLITP